MALQVIHGSAAWEGPRPVLTVGNFDGVHIGHRVLLQRLVERSAELGAPACVYTFDPPPRVVLEPDRAPPRIQSLQERLRHIEAAGVDVVIVEPFTPAFARRPASWFIEEVLLRRLRPVAMVLGHDFRFGRGRVGTAEHLVERLPHLPVEQVRPVQVDLDGQLHRVSSSLVREAVVLGRVEHAAVLLGRPFALTGRVVPGDGRGRTLGIPTANLHPEGELLPGRGVYACLARLEGGEAVPAVTNVGFRPTFAGRTLSIEAHLLDFEGDLLGRRMVLEFVHRIREERRFEGPADLVAQIRLDIRQARQALGT